MINTNSSIIDEIISKIDILDLISEHVVLRKSGSNYQGLCPFHQEKTPSFIVNQQKQIFRCFGCGVGGNIFEFYKNYYKVDFKEALQALALRIGIDINQQNKSNQYINVKAKLLEIYKLSLDFYQWIINHQDYGVKAINYLNSRNINNDIINKFKIGYAPNNWNSLYLHLKKNFSYEELKESGLFLEKSNGELYDRFRDRIIFPIKNERGETIAFGGRIIEENNQAKYINSPETLIYTKGDNLYSLDIAKNDILKKDYVILVEGYFDVIRCHIHGFENTIASLGTALTPNQGKKILKYTKNIVIAYDSDNAGQLAIERSFSILKDLSKNDNIDLYVLEITNSKDVDEFLNKNGKEEFQEVINNKKLYFDFKLTKILNSWQVDNLQSKKEVFDKCIELLLKIDHPIQVNEMINKIINFKIGNNTLEFKEADIRQRLNSLKYRNNKEEYYKNNFNINFKKLNNEFYMTPQKKLFIQKTLENFNKVKKYVKAEQGIIYFLIERSKAINYIKEKLEDTKFFDEIHEKIKNFIFENSTLEKPVTWNELLKNFTESKEQSIISQILSLDDIDIKSDKLLKDYIKVVKSNFLNHQKQEAKNDIMFMKLQGNNEVISSLLGICQDIEKDIQKLKSEIFS
ncbi:MAG: DNA primase [Candidatus Sericytochromatia bacterium]|nr:MAG: DNA primase [Candidatus Sericytochromatia bacterium]